ncbi:hypothetical protein [Variovorax paradoxus]|uniref:Uncharacterized protein n=1 Tax=Variovorax paradoxus TaxID=34073 RepID=A0A679JQA7_VARPD|nr:hypothetical protein VVAX_04741 [Variovorax paradoxus]
MSAPRQVTVASVAELKAQLAAALAAKAIAEAIASYQEAGYGSLVTTPLHDALANVNFSLRQVKS